MSISASSIEVSRFSEIRLNGVLVTIDMGRGPYEMLIGMAMAGLLCVPS